MWCPEKRECMTLAYPLFYQILARLIVLPASSAELERTFSIMSHIKTPLCNRLNTKTLDCLIRIKMDGGESDTTQPSLAIMPILAMTIVLLFPHGIKKCDEVGQSLKLLEYQLCLDLNSKQ